MDMSFFGEMAWKSALISGAALALAYVLRSRAAADRALVLKIGVVMLLLLPFIALVLPALQIEAWAAPEPAPGIAYVPGPEIALSYLGGAALQPAGPTIWDDPTPLVLLAYLGGLAMVGSRLLLGLLTLRRWTKAAREVDCPKWLRAFDRARWVAPEGERLRLLISDAVPSPLSWGWRDPVILIDPDTLAEPEEAAAVLAHEVAHVARRDWPALMLTRLVAALFWFNPLVWWLRREVVQQAEEAADCEAAHHVEPAHYARTLLSLAQVNGRLIPANSIAPTRSALSRRIKAILDRRMRERPAGSAWTGVAAILCIGIAAPVAAMQLIEAPHAPRRAPEPRAAPLAPILVAGQSAPLPPAPSAPPEPPETPDIAAPATEALNEILPRIPHIVSAALAEVDPDEIERSISEALRTAEPELRRLNREDAARVRREIHAAMARVRADRGRIDAARREARRAVAAAPVPPVPPIHVSLAAGADGMAHGAAQMEAGAERMEREAQRLRSDRAYRESVIARNAARGRAVTHEELIEAADGMREGAEGMREGAREMRRAAERMRSRG